MPGIEISALPAATVAQTTDVFPADQLPGPVTRKISLAQVIALVATSSVTSISGTANQVLANGTSGTPQVGSVTLTTPQDIATTSSPTFSNLTLTGGLIKDVNGNTNLGLLHLPTAVNYLTIQNSPTGTAVLVQPAGTDTDIQLSLVSKGAGAIVQGSQATVNQLQFFSGATLNHITQFNFPLTTATRNVAWQDSDGTVAWLSDIPAVSPAALTATPDTNVTITLGGTPATALLQATSITLGWTGLLAITRGGTGVGSVTTVPTATAFAGWDANSNLAANNFLVGTTLVTNSGGTTTLTVSSAGQYIFSGTTFETVEMPVVATLATGQAYRLINDSTNALFVISSGSNAIVTMQPLTQATLTYNGVAGTAAASWDVQYTSNTIGVQSITGTANQVIASSATGNVTLSLPQDIATTSSPTFAGLTLTNALTVPNGGTGDQSFTAYAVICGGTTSTSAFQSVASVGTTGQVLTSNGPGALPTFQSVSGSGTVNSGTANQLAYYATTGTAVSGLTSANSSVLVTDASGVPSLSTTLPASLNIPTPNINDPNGNPLLRWSNSGSPTGWIQINNSGVNPGISAIGSGTNLNLSFSSKGNGIFNFSQTNSTGVFMTFSASGGSGLSSFTFPTSGTPSYTFPNLSGTVALTSQIPSGLSWSVITGTTQAMTTNNGYISNAATLITYTLPTTAAVGDLLAVGGINVGGWQLTQAAGQSIQVGIVTSTVGTGGSVTSQAGTDGLQLVCVVANTKWANVNAPQSAGLTIV